MRLDCSNLQSALETSAAILNLAPTHLLQMLSEAPVDADESVEERVINSADLFSATETVHTAVFFHMSRVDACDRFRKEGIQPRSTMIDALWELVRELAPPRTKEVDFRRVRSWLETTNNEQLPVRYQVRSSESHDGPYGMLLQEPLLRASSNESHYLQQPETIQDILEAIEARYKIDLSAEFMARTTPVIVSFTATAEEGGTSMRDMLVEALRYVRIEGIESDEVSDGICAYDGYGRRVPANAILSVVEVTTPVPPQCPLDHNPHHSYL